MCLSVSSRNAPGGDGSCASASFVTSDTMASSRSECNLKHAVYSTGDVLSPDSVAAWQEGADRFRFLGMATLVFALIGWAAWFYPFDDLLDRSGTPLGGDFVMLYVAGQSFGSAGTSSLYDEALNQQAAYGLFPEMEPGQSWPYRYPPTVAVCMAPLARLPFRAAFSVFCNLQFLLLALAIYWLHKYSELLRQQPRWIWAIIGAPLILEVVIGGQASLLVLALVSAFGVQLRNRRYAIAGMLLALALYKPNVLALFTVGCLVAQPRLVKGFLITVVAGGLITYLAVGLDEVMAYGALGTQLATSAWTLESPAEKVQGLAPFFQAVFPAHGKALCLAAGLTCTLATAIAWRRTRIGPNSALAILLALNALLNPYVPIYDLVLLIPGVLFAVEAVRCGELPSVGPWRFQSLAVLLFAGPHVSQSLSHWIGLQFFPVTLLICTFWFMVQADRSSWPLVHA